jgi:hypothetical protein
MGNLSENFNNRDFMCRCASCKGAGEYKIHLGLVGALEFIASHFRKKPTVVSAYRCEDSAEAATGTKRSLHAMGKAAHIFIEGVPLAELYSFVKDIPEIKGIGIYPKENSIHVDTRPGDRVEWVKEEGSYAPLSLEKKKQYGLI